MTTLEQQREDISIPNNSISGMNKISRAINNNTETINRNLKNLADSLHDQNTRLDLFEAVVTLIVQEQHFFNFFRKN